MVAELVSVRMALRRRLAREPLDELLSSLSSKRPWHLRPTDGTIWRVIRSVEPALGRLPGVPNSCLYRSLARYALLHRAGRFPHFVAALPPTGPSDFGHAWVELDGHPYDPADAEDATRMVVTFRYPAQAVTTR